MVLSILSCSDKSKEPTPKYYSEFGYFDANIDGNLINLKNKQGCAEGEKLVRCTGGVKPLDNPTLYSFQVYLSKNELIDIDISPEKIGLALSQYPQTFSNILNSGKGAMVTIEKNYISYFPMKAPCKVQVDSIFYIDDEKIARNYEEFVVGRLSGVLYNYENPKDSIIIRNAHFGVH